MKVQIISGNEAGTVKDLPQIEAETAIQTGFAKPCDEPVFVAIDLALNEESTTETKPSRKRSK